MMHKPNLCPCGSTQTYEYCCEPFHKNFQAPTCEALMRSRYSAFVFGLVDYLYETTHPSHRSKSLRDEIVFTCKKVAWTKLEVLSTWQGGINDKVGKVSFCAFFIQEGKEGSHIEHSRFKRFEKKWFYVDGEVIQDKNLV